MSNINVKRDDLVENIKNLSIELRDEYDNLDDALS